MPTPKANSKSYLLRFWKGSSRTSWRAHLVSIGTHGEHKYFATPESLVAFLQESEPDDPIDVPKHSKRE